MVLLQEELEYLVVDDEGAVLAPLVEPVDPRLEVADVSGNGRPLFATPFLKNYKDH